MEVRLKKERNRLFLRIILILLAVWLTVSAVFCAVRLIIEKANAQNRELSALSRMSQLLTVENGNNDAINQMFLEYTNFVFDDADKAPPFDSQLVITDRSSRQVIADTARTVGVRFYTKGSDGSYLTVGLLNYDTIRSALTDEQYAQIEKYLSSGEPYELICTKLQADIMLVPLELQLILTDGENYRTVETYDLSQNRLSDYPVYDNSDISRNTVPKDFLLNGTYNRDFIGSLTKQQRKSAVEMLRTGTLTYIFYASDYLSIDNVGTQAENYDIQIQYAKEINLFDNCRADLFAGVAVIFGFFLTIAVILCVMIWKTVKAQLIQEQKRLDLTNALAHDIKTPLFVISGYAYSLKENIDETERGLYLDKIIEQTDEVNGLVHKMLSFSKLDSYKMTLNKTDFDLLALTQALLEQYDLKRIVLMYSGDNTVNADKELIKTVLQNLMDNAMQYSLPGSDIHIVVRDKSFSISNQAEPLTKAELKQLWLPYFRKDKSRRQKGNGLGLSIVKSILDLHGAKYDTDMKDQCLTIRIRL